MNHLHTCYLIASSPRSGSQLLDAQLSATGVAGFPDEHFNPWHMGDATNFFPDHLRYSPEHIRRLIDRFATSNGVFGTKAHFLQVVDFVGLGSLETLYPVPLKYVSLRRRDVVRQGISLARAAQTGSYNSGTPAARDPIYNYYQISQCIREVCVDAKGWETYFHERGIEPCRVIYEDFVIDQAGTIRRVLEYLGIALPADFQCPTPSLEKQADSISDAWVEKYLRGDRE